MRVPLCICVALMLALSGTTRGDDKRQADTDKRAFERAQKAANVKTWDAAIAILGKIDIDKLDDEEVIEYVDFSLRCAKIADALGIDRKSNPDSPTDVIAKIDWAKVIATLVQKVVDEGPGKVAELLADARKIQKQIPRYLELDEKLSERYGK
jgi:uncharacterized protein (DUF885 family)